MRHLVKRDRLMGTLPWDGVPFLHELREKRTAKPRSIGVTGVIDSGLGLMETGDVLQLSGAYIDLWKLSFGTSCFVPTDVLERKLAMIREHDILTCPGGTLFEAVIMQHECDDYMRRAAQLGFTAVEVSDGTINLPLPKRRRAIECARECGLVVIAEVGKKDPRNQPRAAEMAEQALQDLEWGARHVIVEGRESGIGVGVFDTDGKVRLRAVEIIAGAMGDHLDKLIWEAPLKQQQSALLRRFGQNVGFGNIDPRQVLAVEALRDGLRFETLKAVVDALTGTDGYASAFDTGDLPVRRPDEYGKL